jgi:hypothetical protein
LVHSQISMLTSIFALHRVGIKEDREFEIEDDIKLTLDVLESDIQRYFKSVEPIVSKNQWKYNKQLSGAIQEYVEAVSFKHYLSTETVITLDDIQQTIPNIIITHADYLLGIMDLTGELMRYAISNLADTTRSESKAPDTPYAITPRRLSHISQTISVTLRDLNTELTLLDINRIASIRGYQELNKKIEVFRSSLAKLEYAQYSLLVRMGT